MPTVLIADDNRQITSILEEYAKKEGHTPYVAFNGQEALDLFNKIHPDVILLDVMMPKIDGFEVCREIRKKSDAPVIMITALGEKILKESWAWISARMITLLSRSHLERSWPVSGQSCGG